MRAYHRFAALLCALVGLFTSLAAPALDPDRAIRQLTHVWYENQLPQGTVLAIAQDRGGAIWLATYGGLVQHSGAGFNAIDPRVAPALKSSAITAVGVDHEGTLWVGTLNGGLYRRQHRELEAVPLPGNVESVFGIVEDSQRALWLTTNAGVVRIDGEGARLFDTASGFPPRGFYRAIVADPSGGVWIAADGLGVLRWKDGDVDVFDESRGLPSKAVYSLAIAADGTPWVGTQMGPARYRDGRFEREPRAAALDDKRIYSLYGDRDGNLWFAPLGVGLCRLTTRRFDCDNSLAGLGGETVRSMAEDHEGNLWIGTTSSGLHRLSNSKLVTATGAMDSNAIRAVHADAADTLWVGSDGAGLARYQDQQLVPAAEINAKLPSQLIRAIHTGADGTLWVGGTEGVSRIGVDGAARHFSLDQGLPGTIVFAFAPSRDGGMWVGTLQGVAKIRDDAVEAVAATRGDDTRALYEDADGRLWIGLRSGLRCLHQGQLDHCGTDGLPGMSVFAFTPDADGSLWVGTSIGLMRIRDGLVHAYTQRAGFYGDAVFVILDDDAGNLWISSNRGIARLARAELAALDRGERNGVAPTWYGKDDGMLSSQANGASQSPGWRSRDGRLWFGTAKGVVIVDPRKQLVNEQPPPVAIERVLVDGGEVDPRAMAAIGPGIERIELHYAGMSYVAPAAVRYRYRMEGFDRGWNEAGAARSAHYTNLPPGDYRFRVTASNNDGVWNEEGASLAFRIVPAWHATWWFRAFALLVVLGLLGALYRVRVWQLRERASTLSREVAEQTEALRLANERLRRIAELDGLTGIANRGTFNRRLLQAWREHADERRPLAVLLGDIDAFKAYNDSCGHLAGDDALTRVAATLSHSLRGDGDLAARYGGEEFAMLLPDCRSDEAAALAERLLEAVRALHIAHRASDVVPYITLSIGVASVIPGPDLSPETLVKRADEALYAAKEAGRNRVVVYRTTDV